MKTKLKIGISLGSGGAKGLAHIGVLQVLDENKIPISCVSGSSIGSVIGGLYCLGLSPFVLEQKSIMGNYSKKNFFKFNLNLKAIYSTRYIHERLFELYADRDFKDLKIPFFPVATDLVSGKRVVFDSGKLLSAIEASSRIPIYYEPIERDGLKLVDGGVTSPIPIDILKDKCDFVIAVPVHAFKQKKLSNYKLEIINVIERSYSIVMEQLLKLELKSGNPDFIISLKDTYKYGSFDFQEAEGLIKQGRKVAEKLIPKLKEKIKEKENQLNTKSIL